jgi:hypothetical protein
VLLCPKVIAASVITPAVGLVMLGNAAYFVLTSESPHGQIHPLLCLPELRRGV